MEGVIPENEVHRVSILALTKDGRIKQEALLAKRRRQMFLPLDGPIREERY